MGETFYKTSTHRFSNTSSVTSPFVVFGFTQDQFPDNNYVFYLFFKQ